MCLKAATYPGEHQQRPSGCQAFLNGGGGRPTAAEKLATSNQTARNDLQGLVTAEYRNAVRLNLKTEAFIKSDKFDSALKGKLKAVQKNLFP